MLVSRDAAYAVRDLVIVAPVSRRVRGLPVEVPLGPPEGLPVPCAANVDTLQTIAKSRLRRRVSRLPESKIVQLDEALRFALGLGR